MLTTEAPTAAVAPAYKDWLRPSKMRLLEAVLHPTVRSVLHELGCQARLHVRNSAESAVWWPPMLVCDHVKDSVVEGEGEPA